MNPEPLLLESQQDRGRQLVRVDVQPNGTKDESWLQELLFSHPELLPVEYFEDSFGPAIPIARELPTNQGGYVDNVYVSPMGRITLVETKLWKNPDRHRTVVAQVIEYAGQLAMWDYDHLAENVLRCSRNQDQRENLTLEQKVATSLKEAEIDLDTFQENVSACLESGEFLVLIIGERISPNVAFMTKSLQAVPGLGFTMGLVEMRLYALANGTDWPLLVVPDVVGKTVEKTRGVVRLIYEGNKPKVEVQTDEPEVNRSQGFQKLDSDQFFKSIPRDLIDVYRRGSERWLKLGGNIRFTNKMVFWCVEIEGNPIKPIRSTPHNVSVITQAAFDRWFPDCTGYETYLGSLSKSPISLDHAQGGKMFVDHDKLSSDDLQVIFDSAITLVEAIRNQKHQQG